MSIVKKRLLVYLVMLASLMAAVRLVRDIVKLTNVDERIIEAETELTALKLEQKELQLKLQETESPAWQERQIREVLKMARPNEAVVVIPEEVLKVGEVVKVGEVREEELPNWHRWWRLFVY